MSETIKVPLIKSTFYEEEKTKTELCNFILDSTKLSMGEQCTKLEVAFAEKQGRHHAVFVSSGSTANLILIQSLLNLGHLKIGDKVAVSAITWATNVMPLIQLGLIPVAVDCDINTLNVSSKGFEQIYTPEVKCFFITNVLGMCGDLDNIKDFCEKNNVILIEDNCESLGSKFKNIHTGNFGMASTFSTYVGHHISTIEGGFVVTDDTELYEMLTIVRAHGWDRNLDTQTQQKYRNQYKLDDFYAKYTFYDLAYNTRPTEIQGFLGNVQIQYWDDIVKKREYNFFRFLESTRTNSDIIPLNVSHMSLVSNFAMPVLLNDDGLFRKYKDKFSTSGIEIRPIIAGNITKQPFYTKYIQDTSTQIKADFIHENGFYFGNNPELTEDEINFVCSLLRGY